MDAEDIFLLAGAGLIVYAVATNQTATSALETGVETVQAAVMGWASVNEGPTWVPVINQSEAAYGLPANLLARQAYQESHFRQEVIDGTKASPAGALGLMQLMPQDFGSVTVPIPFNASDTQQQISDAAAYMARLYAQFADWGLALAAYDDGPGNVQKYLAGQRALPTETQNYVAQILTDVPLASSLTGNA